VINLVTLPFNMTNSPAIVNDSDPRLRPAQSDRECDWWKEKRQILAICEDIPRAKYAWQARRVCLYMDRTKPRQPIFVAKWNI